MVRTSSLSLSECELRIYTRESKTCNAHSQEEIPAGTLGAKSAPYDIFCFDHKMVFKDILFDIHSVEISSPDFLFLFRISDASQRLAIHESGLISRLVRALSLGKKFLFFPEGYDTSLFGDIGTITHFEEGFVYMKVKQLRENFSILKVHSLY